MELWSCDGVALLSCGYAVLRGYGDVELWSCGVVEL